jgi:wobble nucleotide-excising tRNase
VIKRIKLIQGVGSFVNYRPDTSTQASLEFAKSSIIYANNGYGKSTIANILKSLSENDTSKIIQRKSLKDGKPVEIDQEVVIVRAGGESIYQSTSWAHTKTPAPKIYVFDQQFISDNLFVHEVEAAHKQKIHILVIGEEGTTLHSDLVKAKEEEKRLLNLFEDKKKELSLRQKNTNREDYLLIESREFKEIEKDLKIVESKIEIKNKGERIRVLTNKAIIQTQNWSAKEIFDAFQSTLEDIHNEAEVKVKNHFQKHTVDPEKAEPIIRELLEQAKETCPFCGQDISQLQSLIDAYRSYFNQAHRQLLQNIEEIKSKFDSWNPRSEVLNIKSNYTEIENAAQELKNYTEDNSAFPSFDFELCIKQLEESKIETQKLLERKITNLSFIPPTDVLNSISTKFEEINTWSEKVNQIYVSLAKRFEDHLSSLSGLSIDDLKEEQDRYKACLKRFLPEEIQWCKEYNAAENEYAVALETTKQCTQKLSDYSKSIFEDYQKDINETLKDLGADFKVDRFSEKVDKKQKQPYADFQLVINNTQVPLQARGDNPEFQNTLSEGEKNTLSFAFFINWIKRQNDLHNAIVVFDDPLSSHDDNRKNLTARIIRDISNKIKQSIILTHNKDFLFILAEKLTNPKVISLRKDKVNGSKLILFDLEKEQKLGQHQRIDDLERYLDEDYCSVQDAQEKIRLCIETALQFKYYRHLSGITTLGKILDKLKELNKVQPDLLKTLRDLNEVSSDPHHGEHKKTPLKELTRADLLPDIRKTLDILEEI